MELSQSNSIPFLKSEVPRLAEARCELYQALKTFLDDETESSTNTNTEDYKLIQSSIQIFTTTIINWKTAYTTTNESGKILIDEDKKSKLEAALRELIQEVESKTLEEIESIDLLEILQMILKFEGNKRVGYVFADWMKRAILFSISHLEFKK